MFSHIFITISTEGAYEWKEYPWTNYLSMFDKDPTVL